MNKMTPIDIYISSQPVKARLALKKIRRTVKLAVPDAEECLSYKMPAFKFHGILMWFAAHTNHYAIYIRPKFLEPFKEELKKYDSNNSTIRFSFDKEVPVKLITKIVKHVAKENMKKR